MQIRRGKYSINTHPSKFTENINTKKFADQAVNEGYTLRNQLNGRRILEATDEWELKNAWRL
jgi:hypothetical protein